MNVNAELGGEQTDHAPMNNINALLAGDGTGHTWMQNRCTIGGGEPEQNAVLGMALCSHSK